MANVKISALTGIADAAVSATDIFPGTDADAGTPTTYKYQLQQVRSALLAAAGAGWDATDHVGLGASPTASGVIRVGQGALAGASTPLINSTVTWNNAATTFTHILVNVTNTASGASSLLADLQVGGVSKWRVSPTGGVQQAGGLIIDSGGITVTAGTTAVQALTATTVTGSGNIETTGGDFKARNAGAFYWATRSIIQSPADGQVALFNNAATDFSLLQFGGLTAGFPALKRSATELHVRLANDSAFAPLRAGDIAGIAGSFSGAVSATQLTLSTAVSKIIPGATSLSHRNNADNADNLLISDAGAVTTRSTLTVTAGGLTVSAGATAVQAFSATTGTFAADIFAGATAEIGWTGRATIKSSADGMIELYNDALGAFTKLSLGGTTNAFPAFTRSGTNIQCTLADGSALTNFSAKQINGTSSLNEGIIGRTSAGVTVAAAFFSNDAVAGDNHLIDFYTDGGLGTLRGSIDYNRAGGLVRYNTSSDGTLKTIHGDAPVERSVEILRSTRLREYSWKSDRSGKRQIGPIAQELQATFPGAVSAGGDVDVWDEEAQKMRSVYRPWAVDKTAFSFHLLAGWQEHERRICALEARLLASK